MNEEVISREIVDSAMKVHAALGAGLLESAYEACLAYELGKRNLPVRSQVPMPVRYEDIELEVGYRLDILAGESVVIEVKSCQALLPVHTAQLLSYLKLGHFRLGFLLNFNVPHMRNGIRRIINGFEE
jgi:GxxExxY protein